MTTVYYAGAEQAAHRNLLADCGVGRYGFNLTNLARAVKHLHQWDVSEHLPENAEWVLYADRDSTWEMVEPLLSQQPHLIIGPGEWSERIDTPFAPFWTPSTEPGLDYIALLDEAVKNQTTLRKVLVQHNQSSVVAVTGSSRGIERLDAVVSSAWIAAQKHGETQVWAKNSLRRYPNSQKSEARSKHRADIARLGIDADRVLADDPTETARLAIVSWQAWEERHARRGSNLVALPSNPASAHPSQPGSAAMALAKTMPMARHDPLLPSMALDVIESRYTDSEGREVLEETPAIKVPAVNARQCNTCFLAANCPAFQPDHACAFAIPIEIRTKDQLQAVMRSMVEMQSQRVLFGRYAEELDGQGFDPAVSAEMDRFFRLLAAMRDISDTRDVLRLELEARAGAGMLSRLFGSDVGSRARAVSVAVEADEVIDRLDPD